MRTSAALIMGVAAVSSAPAQSPSPVHSDEAVTIFPTCATRSGDTWTVPIHGWIYELEPESTWRREAIDAFGVALGLTEDRRASPVFRDRARPFLADNEGDKRVGVAVDGRVHTMPASAASGHFKGTLEWAHDERAAASGWLTVQVAGLTEPGRAMTGRVMLLSNDGLSVVSDIDDTIKISEVGDAGRLLHRTFVADFEAVPGMADAYQQLAARGARFHYVTASPWQLYGPIASFLDESGFPNGAICMRPFRLKDETALSILRSPSAYKRREIEALFAAAPGRRWVLVGDTSEDDPVIFADLRRDFPERVAFIAIRNTARTDESRQHAMQALGGVSPEKVAVFNEPAEVVWDAIH